MIIHEGITNGQPYGVIATGLNVKSTNRKTGNMVQIWILLRNVHPVAAVEVGIDASTICRGCPFAGGNGCYVNVGQSVASIWRAYRNGKYAYLPQSAYADAFGSRTVRFGAYGNPSLIPLAIVKSIADVCAGWTGYYHDWHAMPKSVAMAYGHYFMASTETESSLRLAQSLKLRTFHVSPIKPNDAIQCLATTHNIQCADCLLCAGKSKPAKSIWIAPHGAKVKRAINATQTTNH